MNTSQIKTLSAWGVASFALLVSACGNATNTTANNTVNSTNQNSPAVVKTSPTPASIRGVDFMNYSYQLSVCSEDAGLPKTVKATNGKFKDADNNFLDVTKEEIAYGDVNGDGSEDAVVLIRCGSAAGTLRAFEVQAFSSQNGQVNLRARIDSTNVESDYKKTFPKGVLHYAGETGPKLANGHVIVEALADGSFAGPENVATFDYQLSGDKFSLSGKPTTTKRPK